VACEAGAQAVVQPALDRWGHVDVLVNNAGVAILAEFDEISPADVENVIGVHLFGTIWMCRAVWPHMRAAGYGRIVNISSGAMLGGRYLSTYGAAKAGVLGLTRSLAIEGREHGIVVKTLAPHAGTAATALLNQPSEWLDRSFAENPPELVAPVVGLLAHQACDVSGKLVTAARGHVAELYLRRTRGYADPDLSIESLSDHLAAALDRADDAAVPDPLDPEALARAPFVPKPYHPA
jgi:NAD(P)-dependent dehydrogenase (short-subunit alcohol dehydrogenase family)